MLSVIFLASVFSLTTYAQELRKVELATTIIDYDTDTYKFTTDLPELKPFDQRDYYVRYEGEENWKPLGKRAQNLFPLIENSDAATAELKKFRRKKNIGTGLIVVSLVGGIGTAAFFSPLIGIGSAIVLGGGGAFYGDNAMVHVIEAVARYNQAVENAH
jgi:hypothetical protein